MVTLRLEGVGAHYGRRQILADVTTPTFQGGEVVAVIGPNAAGKSTLFKRIAGLLAGPGAVRVEGSRKGPAGICYMPQETAATAVLTVYEAILLARKQRAAWSVGEDDLAVVDNVLQALDIADIALRNLGELSGGQRQLASIAQVLAREPEIVLMDEPTSALDLQRQIQVLELVRRLARERGLLVLLTLHDLNQALRFADTSLLLHGGGLRAGGPSGEVVSAAMLRRVWGIEARVERCSEGRPHVIVDGVARAG